MRVYPPLRSAYRGPISEKSLWTTSRSGTVFSTCRRAWTSPRLANVMRCSASGRTAWASVLPKRQPELVELRLDLVDGLLTEVADVHQLGLALLHEIADRVDALALQAV